MWISQLLAAMWLEYAQFFKHRQVGKIGRGGRRGGEDGKIHHTVEKGQNDLVDLHNNPLIKHEVK